MLLEKLFRLVVFYVLLIGGARILFFMGKAERMHKEKKLAKKQVASTEHYKYIYTQDEMDGSLYPLVRAEFNADMKKKRFTHDQIYYIETYLRKQLNDKRKFNNNAHAVYSMLKSPLLTNVEYQYLQNVMRDFTQK